MADTTTSSTNSASTVSAATAKAKPSASATAAQKKKATSAKPAIQKKKVRSKAISATARANLQFSVSRTKKFAKKGNYAPHVSRDAPIYLAGVVEYTIAEVLELAGKSALDNQRKRIVPRDVMFAIRNDEELNKLAGGAWFNGGGVVPAIHIQLIPKRMLESEKARRAGKKPSTGKSKKAKKTTVASAEAAPEPMAAD